MKHSPVKLIKSLLLITLCISAVGIGVQQMSYVLADRAIAKAQEMAGVTLMMNGNQTPEADESESIDTEPPQTPDSTDIPETEAITETAESESFATEQTEHETVIETETETEQETETETETEQETETETETEQETETETETEQETETETETEQETETETEAETEPEPETEPETEEPEPEIDSYAQQLLQTDLTSLKEKNSDVFGWIVIPDTSVSYPLLQGEDNTHYLYYNWEGWWNWAGSIYLDYRSSQEMTDFHTIIYGHRMNNDTMFNALKYFADPTFAAEHPSVYVLTEAGVRRYDVFAAYETDIENGHSYRLGLTEPEDQQKLINYALKNSVIPTDKEIRAEDGDRMLTLSTCTISGSLEARWVVHCVLAYELLK